MITLKNNKEVARQLNIELSKAIQTLRDADWDYNHCGDRIKEGDMQEHIAELQDKLQNMTDAELSELLLNISLDVDAINELIESGSSPEQALIQCNGDEIAQKYTNCVYPTVTFIACV